MHKGTAEVYYAFTRTWWRYDAHGQRVPGAGRRTTLARNLTYAEALAVCERYNSTHNPGPLSRKAEFERQS